MTWDEAVAIALALPGAEMATSYGQPAVKVGGNAFLSAGREPAIGFCLRIEIGLKQAMLAACPRTFYETPHYADHPAVLVRHDGPDEAVVHDMIVSAYQRARSKRPPRARRG